MRGKRLIIRYNACDLGLIPAHAGKTARIEPALITSPAHPRACGENPKSHEPAPLSAGSSPRMRGKPTTSPVKPSTGGLIPAHAGKTSWSGIDLASSTAHPRACGENAIQCQRARNLNGSSPRMRGKLCELGYTRLVCGLIPAHAGKTVKVATHFMLHRAHPRACGENPPDSNSSHPISGSSPRMRGKLLCVSSHSRATGLIPAHAGKTLPVALLLL